MNKIDPKTVNAIGYKEDFTHLELVGKHVDGVTGLVFETEEAYLNHVSPVTGYNPTEVQHQDILTDGEYTRQAELAKQRTEEAPVE
jgi:hypothetical protein